MIKLLFVYPIYTQEVPLQISPLSTLYFYDRQNKDLTLFHLSVKDEEQSRYHHRRHKSVDPSSLQHKDKDIQSAR